MSDRQEPRKCLEPTTLRGERPTRRCYLCRSCRGHWTPNLVERVGHLIASSAHGAIALERLPRAAGATRWFEIRSRDSLHEVISRLRPASLVTFYFDDHLPRVAVDHQFTTLVRSILERDPDVPFGRPSTDGVEIEMDFIDSSELEDVARTLPIGLRSGSVEGHRSKARPTAGTVPKILTTMLLARQLRSPLPHDCW